MSNWQLKSVEIENLFNYRNCQLSFDKDMTALVVGENLDSEGANSNGAGKSSLFDAISWIIWGNTPRGSSFEDIVIKRGSNMAGGSITLADGFTLLRIDRSKQLSPAKDSLQFFKKVDDETDMWEEMSLRTKTLTQKQINSFFGFDEKNGFADYLSQVYFSNTSSSGFLSSDISPADRQQILERFLNLSVVDEAVRLIKEDLKPLSSELLVYQTRLDMVSTELKDLKTVVEYQTEIKVLGEKVTSVEEEIRGLRAEQKRLEEVSHKKNSLLLKVEMSERNLVGIKQTLKRLKTEYEQAQKEIGEGVTFRKEVEGLKASYEDALLNINQISKELYAEKDRHTEVNASYREATHRVKSQKEKIDRLEKQASNVSHCPECNASLQFSMATEAIVAFDLEALTSEIESLSIIYKKDQQQVEALSKELTMVSAKKESIEDKLLPYEKEKETFLRLQSKLKAYDFGKVDRLMKTMTDMEPEFKAKKIELEDSKKELDSFTIDLGDQFDTLSSDLDVLRRKIDSYVAVGNDTRASLAFSETMLGKVKKLTLDVAEYNKVMGSLGERGSQLEYWKKAFVDIKRDVLRGFVPVFENTVNDFLSTLEITERVKFSLEGLTKKGTVKPGFKIEVFDGNYWAPFNSYSGGEKSRILVSVGFAMKELANQRVGGKGFGFLLCDEILDDLDQTGIEFFFDVLKNVSGQKYIITHTKTDEAETHCSHVITATKRNGESTVRVSA